ncbi:uncharacterized protein [Panulirus ornatus]|uniref:uncharacterized protein n=1 Tax=Panulirus ornatus TaxID=150431 RepID=UPI003A871EB7
MASDLKPLILETSPRKENKVLHYYTGRVRAFWKDKIFFSDQRNVAVVNVQNLFLYGKRADTTDIPNLEALVAKSEWDEAPELHSYVTEYPDKDPPSWPYQLSGKSRWQAQYAWMGSMPEFIMRDCQNEIVYMPVSYYTGLIIKQFDDKILFGDTRNNVMVNVIDFYISGKRASKKETAKAFNDLDPLIHAYITKLKVLANTKIIGPEPQLPTWPKQHYASDTWVAKFAWQGEMPQVVREEVGRYRIIRMNEWDIVGRIPWRRDDQLERLHCQAEVRKEYQQEKSFTNDEDVNCAKVTLNSTFIPVEQESGIMKGSLLLADHQQGLMTSFVDVIAFTKESFYINGEKFRSHMSLSDFFQNRKILLSAWVVPLAEPKVIFHITVVWYAVCVWFGNVPKDLEDIKRQYGDGKLAGTLTETSDSNSTKRFTHFMGNITNLSFASGVLKSRVSPRHTVKISFKRKALYMYGYKFHSSCSLLDKQQILESYTWSVLAYPVSLENQMGNLRYHAIALWQYQYQHFIMMDVFQRIVSEASDPKINTPYDRSNGQRENSLGKELGRHLSGWIMKVSQNYGIIQSGSTQVEATCLYFHKSVLYLDGELLPEHVTLNAIDKYRQCNMYAKPMPSKDIDGFIVTMEAVTVWIGKKPSLLGSSPKELTQVINGGKSPPREIDSSDTNSKTTHYLKPRELDIIEDFQMDKYQGLTSYKEDNFLCVNEPHVVESIISGSILMTNDYQGLMTWFKNIVAFSIKIFYVNGEKFENKYTSLTEFFSGSKIVLKAWIVPLKEPKIIFNCLVIYEALCVWTGQEPADLKNFKTEKCYGIQLKKLEKLDRFPVPKVVFTYFIGNVTRLSQFVGVITSKTDKGNIEIAFWNNALFLDGARVHNGFNLNSLSSILTSSLWSVLAFPITPKEFQGKKVRYWAVSVWHHNDQHKIVKELLFGTSSKVQDWASDILSLVRPASVEDMSSVGTGSVDKFMCGFITTAKDQYGIVKCVSNKSQEYTYVLFHHSVMWIDGWGVTADVSLSLIDQSLQCGLYAHPTPKQELDGCQVTMIASVVWLGKKPHHIIGPCSSEDSRLLTELDEITVSRVKEVRKKLEKTSLQDISVTALQNSQEGSGARKTLDKSESESEESGHKYVGKHITGRIIDKCKGGGVAQWHSIQLEGEVYIEFARKNISIDLSPMNKKTKVSVLQARPCNFFVVPVPHREVCGYTVSLEATCGWVGSKPSHIPPPGTQDLSKVDLSGVHVTPVDKSCCNGKSPIELLQLTDHRPSPHHFQCVCGSHGSILPKTMTHTQPEAISKDKSHLVTTINGQSRSKNKFDSYVVEDSLHNMTNTLAVSAKSYFRNCSENTSELWEDGMRKSHLRGTIIELHSNVGRLQGEDGSQHYFSRDHCYLYGVNLRYVELWHVLVQGEEALYCISEITPGTDKVQGVWVGALKVNDVQKTAAYIYEWCKKNLVPDRARDLLVHQLKVS